MQRVGRFKFVIFATIACAILFCIAAFSVSLAKWDGGGNATAEANGSVGQFYVEYPNSATLKADTYYLQVVNSSSDTQATFYIMKKNTGDDIEYILQNVKLEKGQIVSVCTGTAAGGKDTKTISNKDNLSCYTLSGNNATIAESGIFSFYYMVQDNTWASNKRDTNLYATVAPVDASFKPDVTIKCKDGDIRLNVTVDHSVIASTDTARYGGDFHIYIHTIGITPEAYPAGGYPGTAIEKWDGTKYTLDAIDASQYNASQLGYTFGHNKDNMKLDVPSMAVGNYYVDFTFRYKTSSDPTGDTYSVSGLDKSVVTDYGDYTEPSHIIASTTGAAVDTVEPVRQVNASLDSTNSYTYKNYVCVSRPNEIGAGDNSICFVEFYLEGTNGTNLADIPVASVTLTRTKTDGNGMPTNEKINPAPRLYNYDQSKNPTLADLSHEQDKISGAGLNKGVDHYVKGMYCILFFADNDQQYFALDLTIVTTEEASFKLTASATNINHWQRFEQGYGEQWGFYMGGLINNVWLWDPRRTTKFEGTKIYGSTDVSSFTATEGEGSSAKSVEVNYPNVEIDLTLTVNLTEGSIVKPYMLDKTGYRRQENGKEPGAATAYLLPKNIIAPQDFYTGHTHYNTSASVATVSDINLYIPVSGEYTFRIKGKVEPKHDDTNGNWYINLSTGKTQQSKTVLSKDKGWYGVPEFNFVFDELYISAKTTDISGVYTVTYDAHGGKFADGETTTRDVAFGMSAPNLDAPQNAPKDDKGEAMAFGGWYIDAQCTTPYDFTKPVTGDLTLYAQWKASAYTVTFDPKGGAFPDGAATTATAADGGKISAPATNPTRDYYTFEAWYTDEACTTGYDFESEVHSDFTLYAGWTENEYKIAYTLNGGTNHSGNPSTVTKAQLERGSITLEDATPPKGKYFTHWSLSGDTDPIKQLTTGMITATTPIENAITLVAHYESIEVTFDPNGGAVNGSVESVKLTTNDNGTITLPTASRDGYAFMGWYAGDGGDKITTSTDNFQNGQTVLARWYKVTLYYNNPEDGLTAAYTPASLAADTGKPNANPTKWTGHEFAGWYTSDGTTQYNFTSTLTNDIELYAHWTGAAYIVNGTVKAFTETSGTHGTGTEDNAQSYIDTRSGEYSTGTLEIKVYYDGVALTTIEEASARVTHTDGKDTYTINASATSSKGKFLVAAHRYSQTTKRANFKFIGGDAADQIGSELVNTDNKVTVANKGGYYVVGQFSNWKVYEANKMTASNYIHSKTLNFAMPGDKYKIVYISNTANSDAVWYCNDGTTNDPADNKQLVVSSGQTSFYLDEIIVETNKSGTKQLPFVSKADVIRFKFNGPGWSDAHTFRIWSDGFNTWTGNDLSQTGDGLVKMGNDYYFDIAKDSITNSCFFFHQDSSSHWQSERNKQTYSKGNMYTISGVTYSGTRSDWSYTYRTFTYSVTTSAL